MFHTSGSLHAVVDKGLTLCLSDDVELKLNCSSKHSRANDCAGTESRDTAMDEDQPLRLHQFVCTAFRSELNVAENGAGLFIKNGVRVSAHHALLQGAVFVNGVCCKLGRTTLRPGDVVSLKLEQCVPDHQLIAWRGSSEVATKLEHEGKNISERKRDIDKRKGRMMPVLDDLEDQIRKRSKYDDDLVSMQSENLPPFIQYYRETLGSIWEPDVHESAMMNPLPLTIRVLKPSDGLETELGGFGFRKVTESDFTLNLSRKLPEKMQMKLDQVATRELLSNTWIMADEDSYQNNANKKQQLGVFLSDARISGEILQQELNSMIPVSILAAVLKTLWQTQTNISVLDLCAAPGSKTCQLLNILNDLNQVEDGQIGQSKDFTVVANELVPQRASRTRTRCFFQGNATLSHLIVTAGDGRQYAMMDDNYFDFVICDVPCSGDGTIRKSPEKLGKWSPVNAEKNKPLQKELLQVGLTLLKPYKASDSKGGGVLLYSTCSLNPVENEQVICEVLEEMNRNGYYKYEIMDLGSISQCTRVNGTSIGNFLRVLPAASHGGFFVSALRKSCMQNTDRSYKTVPNLAMDKLVKAKERAISYAVSHYTQQCCIDLAKALPKIRLIGCGVPVIYQSNDTQIILQEGCACVETCKKQKAAPLFIMASDELMNSMTANLDQIQIPVSKMKGSCTDTMSNMACIIKIDPSNSLLPAKILQINESSGIVTVQFTARPQILKRVMSNIK